MSLLELQRAFIAYVRDGDGAVAARIADEPFSGLAVYANAYPAQLAACLRDTYERTWAWLGDDDFETVARSYIAERPPVSWTLSDYGEAFPSALERLYPQDPEVAEIAALDWRLRRAFDGPDSERVEPARLQGVDWDRAVLRLAPTLQLMTAKTNCAALWTAMSNQTRPPAPMRFEKPVCIRIWRCDLSPTFTTIDPLEEAMIRTVMAGKGFAEACEALEAFVDQDQAGATAGRILASWLQDGLIADVFHWPPD
jgi:hypothetical protein